jgi:hypothetical protein
MRGRAPYVLFAGVLVTFVSACSDVPMPTQGRLTAGAASVAKSAGLPPTIAVTSTVIDDPFFQILSDGHGAYPNSKTVNSIIQTSLGDWVFDTNVSGSTRTIYLDFSRGIAGSGPNGGSPVPLASGFYQVHLISKCHLYNLSFLSIAPQQTVQCPFRVGQIMVGSQEYAVHMNPQPTIDDGTWPETNPANITCNSTSGSCASWTIAPSGIGLDGLPASVGVLLAYHTTTTKGKTTTTITKQGDFYMSFRLNVTNP